MPEEMVQLLINTLERVEARLIRIEKYLNLGPLPKNKDKHKSYFEKYLNNKYPDAKHI